MYQNSTLRIALPAGTNRVLHSIRCRGHRLLGQMNMGQKECMCPSNHPTPFLRHTAMTVSHRTSNRVRDRAETPCKPCPTGSHNHLEHGDSQRKK
nr:hypothetical protein [uncultured bacterium]